MSSPLQPQFLHPLKGSDGIHLAACREDCNAGFSKLKGFTRSFHVYVLLLLLLSFMEAKHGRMHKVYKFKVSSPKLIFTCLKSYNHPPDQDIKYFQNISSHPIPSNTFSTLPRVTAILISAFPITKPRINYILILLTFFLSVASPRIYFRLSKKQQYTVLVKSVNPRAGLLVFTSSPAARSLCDPEQDTYPLCASMFLIVREDYNN